MEQRLHETRGLDSRRLRRRILVAALAIRIGMAGIAQADWEGMPPPEFEGIEWIRSAPLAWEDLRGKVVLVEFWEYSCINSLNGLPYLDEWYRRYRDRDFVIIGIHTPEFDFSGKPENLRAAVERLGIEYPILNDAKYATWLRWQNNFWPRRFLVDARGAVRYDQIGEGGYRAMERKIRELLAENGHGDDLPPLMEPVRPEDAPRAVCYPTTSAVYAGFRRGIFGSAPPRTGRPTMFTDAGRHVDGRIYLQGRWSVRAEELVCEAPKDSRSHLALRFHASEVYLILEASEPRTVRVDVWLDNRPIHPQDAGVDVAFDDQGQSFVEVSAPRMYRVVKSRTHGIFELRVAPRAGALRVYAASFAGCLKEVLPPPPPPTDTVPPREDPDPAEESS